jgi:hypothetical protein
LGRHSSFCVSNDQNLDHQSAQVNLKSCLFGSDLRVDQKSINKLVEDPLSVAELGKQVAIVYLVFGLLLKRLNYAYTLVHPSQDALSHLRQWH